MGDWLLGERACPTRWYFRMWISCLLPYLKLKLVMVKHFFRPLRMEGHGALWDRLWYLRAAAVFTVLLTWTTSIKHCTVIQP